MVLKHTTHYDLAKFSYETRDFVEPESTKFEAMEFLAYIILFHYYHLSWICSCLGDLKFLQSLINLRL